LARRQGDLDHARDRIRHAIQIAEQEGRTRQNTYPKLLSFLAVLEQERGDLDASHAIFHRIVRLHEAAGDTGTLDYLGARRNEAVILMAWGEYRQAGAILAGIDSRWRAAAGAKDLPPWIASVLGRLALRFDRLDDAERILTDAVARARAESATEDALSIELWLAQVLIQRGRFAEAQRLLEQQEEHDTRPGRWLHVTPATVRAASERERGKFPAANATIDAEIARIRSTRHGARALANALREAARIHLAAGDNDKAVVVANEAVAASRQIARNTAASADVGEALLLLAQAQRSAGQRSESASTARNAAQALGAGLADDHRLTREALALAGS
jgi:tetratricopeptide (TPR) repeat protein